MLLSLSRLIAIKRRDKCNQVLLLAVRKLVYFEDCFMEAISRVWSWLAKSYSQFRKFKIWQFLSEYAFDFSQDV